jgi:hypothetical protein
MALKSDNVEFVCGIVVAILKMATGKQFSMSGIDTIPQKFKVAFNLFFKPVVSGRFGRLHNR